MTIRQQVRGKVARALRIALAFLAALLAILVFAKDAPWAWVSIPLMFGVIAPLLYITLLIDCPKCHTTFGQQSILNIAFNLPSLRDASHCPGCGINLDTSSPGL